ncbi:MAG: tetratricopeptide repeat protein [Bacteroides sp.]|nr:tetratricopeptide repeat protein [Bacteroides sp.]
MGDKDKLDKAIEQAIRQVGQERDAENIATLQRFMAKRQQMSKVKKYIMSITSIAAIIAIVFSLNIYQDNRRMDKLFEAYYTPLEYDSQLMSRGEETISPELESAMESYQKEDYATALQKFEAIPDVDENYLIYKAICLLETEQTEDAITLLELLVANGEGTEYYQQACWYLVLAYLSNHEENKAIELSLKNESIFDINKSFTDSLK